MALGFGVKFDDVFKYVDITKCVDYLDKYVFVKSNTLADKERKEEMIESIEYGDYECIRKPEDILYIMVGLITDIVYDGKRYIQGMYDMDTGESTVFVIPIYAFSDSLKFYQRCTPNDNVKEEKMANALSKILKDGALDELEFDFVEVGDVYNPLKELKNLY